MALAKYICDRPGMYAGNFRIFELEAEYAATHEDLDGDVFFGAGAGEVTEPVIAGFGVVSSRRWSRHSRAGTIRRCA